MIQQARLLRMLRQRTRRALLALHRAVTPHPKEPYPIVEVLGAEWLRELVSAEFKTYRADGPPADVVIVGPDDGATFAVDERSSVGYRCEAPRLLDPSPVIQPRLMNPIVRLPLRAPKMPADVCALANDARRAVTTPGATKQRREATAAWLEASISAHRAYRVAHNHTVADLVDEALRQVGADGLGSRREEVAVVCATNRPSQLETVIENYERQRYSPRRLLIVTNSRAFDQDVVTDRLKAVENASTIDVDEMLSLGTCLNAALDLLTTRFVAKFDDDDRYGAEYLEDMMIAHRFARSAIVGKHSHYAVFDDDGRSFLRFPRREFQYTSWVAGGTLVIDRERIPDLRFRDLTIGEDAALLDDCQRRGEAVFASDRFNYVQHRTGNNTWSSARGHYLRDSVEIDAASRDRMIEP